mgnify:FL=1
MLGMYIHTHWGYNHPYSARTWTLADWNGYLKALSDLGYDHVMIWPQLDAMPAIPTESDRAFLGLLQQVIDRCHDAFGMTVSIIVCPNTIGNEKSGTYCFRNRPYFICEERIDPSDSVAVASFLAGRRLQFSFLANADGLVIIDSDPGGYPGSTNREFVDLVRAQVEVFREHSPAGEFVYWMLAGWESYCRFWARNQEGQEGQGNMWSDWQGDDFGETLTLMREAIEPPWAVYGWLDRHTEAIRTVGVPGGAVFYPYGVIEGEPTFPLMNWHPDIAAQRVGEWDRQVSTRGIMGNAQTHCLQLPHTGLLAHLALGGTRETFDPAAFADRILPGVGDVVANGWRALECGDARRIESAIARIEDVPFPRAPGELGGLLFGDPQRFVTDLVDNLRIRRAFVDLREAAASGCCMRSQLAHFLAVFAPYQERTGFVDAYSGPLAVGLNQPLTTLRDPHVDAVLADFANWREPAIRHGIVPRLLRAIKGVADSSA